MSHDNITWSSKIAVATYGWHKETFMSFLPMSHVAAQILDNYLSPTCGGTLYYADKDCLRRGTLVIENILISFTLV